MNKRYLYIILGYCFSSLLFFACKTTPTPEELPFETPAIADIVMYEVNVPALSTTHNLQGVTARLDSIEGMGINTIWLMPIFPVGDLNSFGSPYCVKDYTAVNPDLGTLTDLQTLVKEAHSRNIAVILDWVANHTAWDNNWIDNEGWYSVDGSGNIISPPGTGWNDVADLNFTNADMRLAMIDAMEYWVAEADIDGFRCDAADYVPFDFWKQALDSLKNNTDKNLILLAEGARADHFTAGFQLNFSWNFLTSIKNVFSASSYVSVLYSTNTSEYGVVPAGAQKLRFITNHDETNINPAPNVYGGQEGAVAASVITYYLQGVPMLYCGQEVGVSSAGAYSGSINWTINPNIYAQYKSILQFYKNSTALRYGTLQTYTNANVAIFKKYTTDETVLTIVNARNLNQTISIDATLQGDWINAITNEQITLSATMDLLPYQYLILKK